MKSLAGERKSSARRRDCTRGFRRIILDDSIASSHSESLSGDVLSNSFLSDDREGDVSMRSEASEHTGGARGLDTEVDTDSFVVSDDYLTDDNTSLTTSDGEISRDDGTSHFRAARRQPQRTAKAEFDKEVPARHSVLDGSSSDESVVVLQSETSECGRDSIAALNESIQLLQDVNLSEGKPSSEGTAVANDNTTDDEDNFESYLKKLRASNSCGNTQSTTVICDDSSFVVSDSDVSFEASVSDDESSNGSWNAEDDKENAGDKIRRNQKDHLLNSIKTSFNSPSVLSKSKAKKLESDVDEHFLVSLSPDYSGKRHDDAELYVKRGIKNEKLRMELTARLVSIFRRQCFRDELPEFLSVKWNNRLVKTAGMCRNRSDRTSSIELSPKVCNTPDRVRDTLVHEMCHAAVWIVDGVRKDGHGPVWKKWAAQCMQRFQSLPVIARCHDYEIDAKFIYECRGCGQKVRRHTRSLDTDRIVCGVCKCRFTLTVRGRAKNAGDVVQLNPFARFVKENYAKHKGPGIKHGEVMRVLSRLFKEQNSANGDAEDLEAPVNEVVAGVEAPEILDLTILSIHD